MRHPEAGRDAVKRFRALAVNESLGRHLTGLEHALQENAALLRETAQAHETAQHLEALKVEATVAKRFIDAAIPPLQPGSPTSGPGL